jgi:predicted small metal-binding protein
MKIESGYDKVWKQGCRECNYLNFGCGHHEEKPSESAELSLKAEARIEELEEVIKAFLDWTTNEHGNLSLLDDVALWKRAEEVLK